MPNTQSKWSSVQSCRCNSIATVAMAATSAAAFRTHLLFYTFTSELQICRQFFLLASCCIILLTRIELWRPNITDRYITICHRRCQLFVPRVRCNTLTFGSRAFFQLPDQKSGIYCHNTQQDHVCFASLLRIPYWKPKHQLQQICDRA